MKSNAAVKGQLIQLEDFDRTLGTDELNLAEFPLSVLTSRPDPEQNTLVFKDDIFDKGAGKTVNRSLVITGSSHFGLPTAIDNDVLLVLVHLSNVRNGLKGKRVEFSRYELVKFLGWDLGGKSYKRLDDSLQRWTSVTLCYKHAWWDSSGKRWRSRTFHILESLELRGRDEMSDDGLSAFVWNDVIFGSFQAGNLKRIDLKTYFKLESAIAKQIYRFTDKRFHRASTLEFDLRTFACEHIGLSRSYDVFDLKRKLQPAVEELEQIGFFVPMPACERYVKVGVGNWRIVLQRQSGHVIAKDEDRPLVQELTRRGVTRGAATELAAAYPAAHIGAKLELHDRLVRANDRKVSKNPAGFLAAAIRHDYQEKRGSVTPKRVIVSPVSAKRQVAEAELSMAEPGTLLETAVRQHLATLSAAEINSLEAEALASGNRMMVQSYERLKENRGPLFEQIRLKLLVAHLERQGVVGVPDNLSPQKAAATSDHTNLDNRVHRQQVTGKPIDATEPPAFRELEPVGSSIGDEE